MKVKYVSGTTAYQVVAAVVFFALVLTPVAARQDGNPDEALTIQRIHRIAAATLAYAADNDRLLPLAMSHNTTNNTWRLTVWTPVPAGWARGWDVPPYSIESRSVYLNSIRGYGVDMSHYWAAGVPTYDLGYEPTRLRPQRAIYNAGFTYNGQLHTWSIDAVTTPTRLPLYMQNFRQNTIGGTLAFVFLCCTNVGPNCRFNPDGYPQPGQTSCGYYGPGYGYYWAHSAANANFSVWVYDHRIVVATVDGSARSEQYEAPIWPLHAQNVNENPWSAFDPGLPPGAPYWMTDCVKPGGTKPDPIYYAGHLRPDNEFNYTLQQCDFGGG